MILIKRPLPQASDKLTSLSDIGAPTPVYTQATLPGSQNRTGFIMNSFAVDGTMLNEDSFRSAIVTAHHLSGSPQQEQQRLRAGEAYSVARREFNG